MENHNKTLAFKGLTPRGIFRNPVLNKPDYGNEDFPKPRGEYQVQIILSEAEATPLLKSLEPIMEQARTKGEEDFAKLKVEQRNKMKEVTLKDFYQVEYDQDTEEPTGNLIFTFKMRASGTSSQNGMTWNRRPAIFDAKGKPLTGKLPEICDGTVGIIAFEARPYFISGIGMAGLLLHLEAVQVIALRSGGERSAADYGFGEEEGWSSPEPAIQGTTPVPGNIWITSDGNILIQSAIGPLAKLFHIGISE